jgi:hypothetical protein
MATQKNMEEQCNELNFQITETQHKKKTTNIEWIGRITIMDNIAIAMTATNICGVQMANLNTSLKKPLLYQFAWKMLKHVKNKKFICWHACNSTSLGHLPIVFTGKLHQFFKIWLYYHKIVLTPTE